MDPYEIAPDVPMKPRPNGPAPDFTKMQDHALYAQVVATLVICVFLSTTAVLTRIATRLWIVKMFGWDDGLAVLSMILNFALTGCFAGLIRTGLTFSTYNTSLREFMLHYFHDWVFWNAVYSIVLYFTFAAIKLSILMLYLRLLNRVRTVLRVGVWFLVVVVIAILIGTTAGLLTYCSPADKVFHPEKEGTCSYDAKLWVAQAVAQVVTDFLILIPPIPFVWRLKASKAQRLALLATLCVGLFVSGIGVARLGILVTQLGSHNVTVDIQYLGLYLSIFEINFAIIAICLPALRQLFAKCQEAYSTHLKSTSAISRPIVGNLPSHPDNPRSNILKRTSISQFVDGPYMELDEAGVWKTGNDNWSDGKGRADSNRRDPRSAVDGLPDHR